MTKDQAPTRQKRIENALWGMFSGDSLAMPGHWIYDVEALQDQFSGGIRSYEPPPHPHPESFMVGAEYSPNVQRAKAKGRRYDILGPHSRYYKTTYSKFEFDTSDNDPEHGNQTASSEERYHYHHGLKAGDITLGSQLVRVLIRSVVEKSGYDEEHFLSKFVEYMLEPENRTDPYTEIYLRSFFENYSSGTPLTSCAARQRDIWSIASHGGLMRPLVLSLLTGGDTCLGLGLAGEHMSLTHRSETNLAALNGMVPLLDDLASGAEPIEASRLHASGLRPPVINGDELFKKYRDAGGPENLPQDEVWDLHTRLQKEPIDLDEIWQQPVEEVVNKRFATACYPEHGWPLILYLSGRYKFSIEESLLANANAGGDSVHRGAILGLFLGAASDTFPETLREGLRESESLSEEINAFAEIACSEKPF